MRVIKFGGTSIGAVERFNNVIKIIAGRYEKENIVVVISAIGGITDKIISAVKLAAKGKTEYQRILDEINRIHNEFLEPLVTGDEYVKTKPKIDRLLKQLQEKIKSVYILGECTPRVSDSIVSIGEDLSRNILAAALNSKGYPALTIDVSELIKTDSTFGEAAVDFELTGKLIKEKFAELHPEFIPVVNGFTGSNSKGERTTLGRSGSDYTASIIAGALDAGLVEIWTDVNGILNADPAVAPEASTLPGLHYKEAAELARLGAKVIFPDAMAPVELKNIPIHILNTFQPEHKGTIVSGKYSEGGAPVIGVTYLKELSLVSINDSSNFGNPGTLCRIFRIIAGLNLPSILLNQSASNQSISFITLSDKIPALMNDLQKEFKSELENGPLGGIVFRNDIAAITVIGRSAECNSFIVKKVSETLDNNSIKSPLFLKSSSEKNVSFAVENRDVERTVLLLHENFFQESVENEIEKINNWK